MSFTEKEVRRQYEKLTTATAKERENFVIKATSYKCDRCPNLERVLILDHGRLPSLVMCDCGGTLHNQQSDTHPNLKAKSAFYLPTLEECYKLKEYEVLLSHIFKGGLIQKQIKSDEK